MKKLFFTCIILIAGGLFMNASAQVERVEKPTREVEVADTVSNVKLVNGTVVPPNQTYDVYDENGNLLGSYAAGKTVSIPKSKSRKPLNCVVIKCPKGFKKGTVCWHCR